MMRCVQVSIVLVFAVARSAAAQQSLPSSAPLLVQGAMDAEVAKLVGRLADVRSEHIGPWTFWHGTVGGYPVIVSKTLKGVSNAAAATSIAVERYHPAAIINQGTSGGHDPDLRLYDIVVGTASVNVGAFRSPYRALGAGSNTLDWIPLDLTAPDGRAAARRKPARFEGDARLIAAAKDVRRLYTRGRIVEGVIGTSDIWNDELDRIARMHAEYETAVEEMETASAAQIAGLFNVPFLGIRIVSDNTTTGIAFDIGTGEACQDFVYEVVKAYAEHRGSTGSQRESDEKVAERLMQMERDWCTALATRNSSLLEPILAEDYSSVNSRGVMSTRSSELTDASAGASGFSTCTNDQMKVRVFGTAAVITGHNVTSGTYNGVAFKNRESYWTDTYVFRNGRWQCVASHSSPAVTR
jgi:adenosylhomocysteine nucleosidase